MIAHRLGSHRLHRIWRRSSSCGKQINQFYFSLQTNQQYLHEKTWNPVQSNIIHWKSFQRNHFQQEKSFHSVACVHVTEKLKNLPEMSTSGGAPRRQTQFMPLAWGKWPWLQHLKPIRTLLTDMVLLKLNFLLIKIKRKRHTERTNEPLQ